MNPTPRKINGNIDVSRCLPPYDVDDFTMAYLKEERKIVALRRVEDELKDFEFLKRKDEIRHWMNTYCGRLKKRNRSRDDIFYITLAEFPREPRLPRKLERLELPPNAAKRTITTSKAVAKVKKHQREREDVEFDEVLKTFDLADDDYVADLREAWNMLGFKKCTPKDFTRRGAWVLWNYAQTDKAAYDKVLDMCKSILGKKDQDSQQEEMRRQQQEEYAIEECREFLRKLKKQRMLARGIVT